MNTYYYQRYLNGMITSDIDLETTNYSIRLNKEWFIGQMGAAFKILSNTKRTDKGTVPVSPEYVQAYNDKTVPNPESNSWLSLFMKYQLFKRQSQDYMKGLWSPDIHQLMEEIVINTNWNQNLLNWFRDPIDYLSGIGSLQINEQMRNKNKPGIAFTTQNMDGLRLGYHENFAVPQFGEIYCETKDERPTHLMDYLMKVENKYTPDRFYTIMMCKKLPHEIFGGHSGR
ncbi:MAG: hypothetical protein LBF37_02370 [Rickettsiales bacterium]|jgi:hypothetical protein|nr:hypothetical protein [Rickettsiales bacterium]